MNGNLGEMNGDQNKMNGHQDKMIGDISALSTGIETGKSDRTPKFSTKAGLPMS
jgi:hypothetical protein